ncbi:MAG: hypothetical protein H6Q44_2280 [Deltaproteobacteria bacterium]|nr:hypothetical protein [Deltaproteobacteria bacterium]
MFPTKTALAARQSQLGRKEKFFAWVRRSLRAGSKVIAKRAATIMARVFVYARGLKSRPSSASKVNTGRKETAITKRAKKLGPATCFTARITTDR